MAPKITLHEADLHDKREVLRNLRPMDRFEAKAIGVDPKKAVHSSETVWAWRVDGVAVCLWGCNRRGIIGSAGVPWMIGTDALDDPKLMRRIAVLSRQHNDNILAEYDKLENHVAARNKRTIRWLRWLGYTVDDPKPVGPYGVEFHRFHWSRNNV